MLCDVTTGMATATFTKAKLTVTTNCKSVKEHFMGFLNFSFSWGYGLVAFKYDELFLSENNK